MDDADELTEEEVAEIEAFVRRYPTFHVLNRLLNSHARLVRFMELGAPEVVILDEVRLRDRILSKLIEAFPSHVTGDLPLRSYYLADVVEVLRDELDRPKSGAD